MFATNTAAHEGLKAVSAKLSDHPAVNEEFVTKASAWRSLIDVMREVGVLERVRERSDPAVQEFLDKPPFPSTWMPAIPFQSVLAVLEKEVGIEGVREIARESTNGGMMKVMRPLVEGLLRIFGSDPASFYKRVPKVMESQVRGITFDFKTVEDGRAELLLSYDYLRDCPTGSFVYWESVLQQVQEVCGRQGTATTERIDTPRRNSARLVFTWDTDA